MTTERVEIVGEIANAHQGEPEQAAELAQRAFDQGADAVKFQVYFAEELLTRSHPRFDHFRNQAFTPDAWETLIGEAAARGRVYCDVFGLKALDLAQSLGATGFKVHSSDTGNIPLLRALGETEGRILLSAGGTSPRELGRAINIVGRGRRPMILHGFQSYPTAVEDSSLCRLAWLREQFGGRCDVGYMDHVAGDDPFAFYLPILAVGLGARMIEKHITLDRSAQGVDYYSSIDVDRLGEFVDTIRGAESALGTSAEAFSESERHYRDTVKKHWVAARALPASHVLQADDLIMKRVAEHRAGVLERNKLLGRALSHPVSDEHPFTRADVEQVVWALPVARSASSRLPGKATLDVAGMPALGHLLERLKRIGRIDRVVFCTTTESSDDELAALAAAHDVACHRGPVEDVLARMLGALGDAPVDIVLRVTGDDLLIDKDYVERAIGHHIAENAEYTDLKALPSGTEVEVFDVDLLRDIQALAKDSGGTEYLTWYVTRNGDAFRTASTPVADGHTRDWRLTLDTPEDYEVIRRLLEGMRDKGKPLDYDMDDIVDFFQSHPDVLKINADMRQRTCVPEVDTRLEWRKLLDDDNRQPAAASR